MIRLLCVDVDGTLTNGNLVYSDCTFLKTPKDSNGDSALANISDEDSTNIAESIKIFNAKDGLGLAYWNHIGRKVAIITGKSSEIIKHRAKELKIDFVFMSVKNKGEIVRELKEKLSLDSSNIAAIGDDLNDISMFKESALNFAPSDCANGIKDFVDIILNAKGGKGAVREAIEVILKKEQIYEDFIQSFA